ncbi:hypothetical protein [Paludisphaera soli]|uniref:hypothetical protein n=1 Tax=Paludisphaera soli TaxID=2712865 RepID=UPI0013ECD742|nr:hypothetical protein [Paludisphaera soli]
MDLNKEYIKYMKKAPATLEVLEGREGEVLGMVPDYSREIQTLERLQAMNRKLLKRMRGQNRDIVKTIRELKAMLDEGDDFVET